MRRVSIALKKAESASGSPGTIELMTLDWLLLIASIAAAAYLLTQAERLAARPRRGTAWRPSARTYRLLVIAPLLIAIGAGISLVSS